METRVLARRGVTSAAEVDQLHVPHRTPQETRAQSLELLHRIGGKAAHVCLGSSAASSLRVAPVDQFDGSLRDGLRGIDHLGSGPHRSFEKRPQQRVMRAAKDQRVGTMP